MQTEKRRVQCSRTLSRNAGRSKLQASYDALESRQLMAGDVSVSVTANNTLDVRGDDASNQVEIRGTDSRRIMVQGLNGTLINGQPRIFLPRSGNSLGGLQVRLEGGDDMLFVEDLRIRQSAVILGGNGHDTIGLEDVRLGQNLTVRLEAGDDAIGLEDVFLNDLNLVGDAGNDLIGLDGVRIRGTTTVRGGLGNDRLAIEDSQHRGAVLISGDDGADFIGIDNSRIRGVTTIETGAGNDTLYLDDTIVSANATVDGGSGADRVELDGFSRFTRTASVTGFESFEVPDGEWLTDEVFEDLLARGALRDS